MRPYIGYAGYPMVRFKRGKVKQSWRVHRLVAETFIPNPLGYSDVNHIDGSKTNNDVSNLEWCTRSENSRHQWRTGLAKKAHHLFSQPDVWRKKSNVSYCTVPRLKNRYRVHFMWRKKKIMFGSYSTYDEAYQMSNHIKDLVLSGHNLLDIKNTKCYQDYSINLSTPLSQNSPRRGIISKVEKRAMVANIAVSHPPNTRAGSPHSSCPTI